LVTNADVTNERKEAGDISVEQHLNAKPVIILVNEEDQNFAISNDDFPAAVDNSNILTAKVLLSSFSTSSIDDSNDNIDKESKVIDKESNCQVLSSRPLVAVPSSVLHSLSATPRNLEQANAPSVVKTSPAVPLKLNEGLSKESSYQILQELKNRKKQRMNQLISQMKDDDI
jgi:hypothetical protein